LARRNGGAGELSHHPFRGMFDLMLALVFFFATAVLISMAKDKNDSPVAAGPLRDEMIMLHTMERKVASGSSAIPLKSLQELSKKDPCCSIANDRQQITRSEAILLEKHRDELWNRYGGEIKKRVLADSVERTISQDLLTFPPAKAVPDNQHNIQIILDEAYSQYKRGYRRIRVEGHTDNIPIHTAQFPSNWELSAARAIWLANALEYSFKAHGVSIGANGVIIEAIGYGERVPAKGGNNNTQEGRSKNRRIEIRFER
jgi:flagellar motor protein MotB